DFRMTTENRAKLFLFYVAKGCFVDFGWKRDVFDLCNDFWGIFKIEFYEILNFDLFQRRFVHIDENRTRKWEISATFHSFLRWHNGFGLHRRLVTAHNRDQFQLASVLFEVRKTCVSK